MELYWMETDAPQSQAAHALLERILLEQYQISQPKFILGPHGKPYLEDGPHFNISHTRGVVAVAIGEKNMGLDIESVRCFHQQVPKRIMSRAEYDWFVGRGELKRDFFALWRAWKRVQSPAPGRISAGRCPCGRGWTRWSMTI